MGRGNKGKEKESTVAVTEEAAAPPSSDEPVEEEYSVEKVIERR